MPALFLVFNHSLSQVQEEDARRSLGVEAIHELPGGLSELWGQIPSDAASLEPILQPMMEHLNKEASPGDFVLIHGDFGADGVVD